MRRFVRVRSNGSGRVGRLDSETIQILDHDDPLRALAGVGAVTAEVALDDAELLAPIEAPEIWCAGVTYERSRTRATSTRSCTTPTGPSSS